MDRGDGPTPPSARDVARVKKIAALLELLDQVPRVRTFTEHDDLPPGAQIGDRYLSVTDGNIARAVSIVLRNRAYAIRALGWVGESEDEILTEKVMRALRRHKSLPTTDLMKYTHTRGVVYLNRVLEALKHSGRIESVKGARGRGYRWRLTV